MRSERAADPDQPTSRHVYFPTPLNRAVLDEAFLGANCQARLVIVLYLSQNSISSTTLIQIVPANLILFKVISYFLKSN